MDYKEVTKVFSWVFRNVKFTAGTDARVYATILVRSHVRDSTWAEGDYFLAKELELTRQQVARSIRRLVKAGLLTLVEPASGRRPATYKVRNEKDMQLLYEKEIVNPEWKQWCAEHDKLFYSLETAAGEIGAGCTDCSSGTDAEFKLCPRHESELEQFKQQKAYRDMLIWERDHPKPESQHAVVEKIELTKS